MALTTVRPQGMGFVTGRRNLIINGAMQVNQRGDATGVTATAYKGLDRFQTTAVSAGTWSISQSSTAPTGFSNSLKFDCTTANASLGATSELGIGQVIEAQDLQHLNYGASGAESLTLSFWVRSNKTGTYAIWFYEYDGGRQRGANYTISSADTWEHKTVTVEGDVSGTINDDNGQGLLVRWILAAGSNYTSGTAASSWESYTAANSFVGQSVNLADNTANEWYVTGVQLEVGTNASDFEHRSYGEEYLNCIRYAYVPGKYGAGGTGSGFLSEIVFPVQMRATPSCTNVFSAGYDNTNAFGNSPEANEFSISNILSGNGVSWSSAPTSIAQTEQTVDRSFVYPNSGSTPNESTDQNIYVVKFGTGAYILFDAEL